MASLTSKVLFLKKSQSSQLLCCCQLFLEFLPAADIGQLIKVTEGKVPVHQLSDSLEALSGLLPDFSNIISNLHNPLASFLVPERVKLCPLSGSLPGSPFTWHMLPSPFGSLKSFLASFLHYLPSHHSDSHRSLCHMVLNTPEPLPIIASFLCVMSVSPAESQVREDGDSFSVTFAVSSTIC